jgi:hypothetical protein
MRIITRVSLLALFALMLMAIPTHAYAQLGGGGGDTLTGPDNQDSSGACDGTMDPDQCMWSPMGGQTGTYYECRAKGSWGGSCIDLITLTNGSVGCATVKNDAHCTCDAVKRTTSGMCFYQP